MEDSSKQTEICYQKIQAEINESLILFHLKPNAMLIISKSIGDAVRQ